MTAPNEYFAILPAIMLAALGVLALVFCLTPLRHSPYALYTVLWTQLGVLVYSLWQSLAMPSYWATPVLGGMVHPNAGHDAAGILLQATAIVIAWMSKRVSQKHSRLPLEFFGLLTAATAALMLLVKSSNLLMTFLTLETSSIFITLLLGIGSPQSPKTALKYLFQSGLSAVIFLWGIVLLYAAGGSLDYRELTLAIYNTDSVWAMMGVGLVLGAFVFKLGLFPFCYWLPDVYEGASWPVLAFLATASKLAATVALIGLLTAPFAGLWSSYIPAFKTVVALSLLWGALSALRQTNFKRLLSLSGIVHAGFIAAAILFSCQNQDNLQAVFFYFLTYIAATLLVVYCLVELDLRDDELESLKNTYNYHPGYAMLLALAVASMAGLPPLGGFVAKFFVLLSGVNLGDWGLVAALIGGSVIALYYYLGILFNVIGRQSDLPESAHLPKLLAVPTSTRVFTGLMITALLGLGLIQGPMSLLWK